MFYRVSLLVLVVIFMIAWWRGTAKAIRKLEEKKNEAAGALDAALAGAAAALGMESPRAGMGPQQKNEAYMEIANGLASLSGGQPSPERQHLAASRQAYNEAAYNLNDQIVTFPYSLISKSIHMQPADYIGTDDEIRVQITALEPQY